MQVERKRASEQAAKEAAQARRDADSEWRARLTRIVPPAEAREVIYPQGKLDRPYMQVYAPDQILAAGLYDPTEDWRRMAMYSRAEIFTLRARQSALRLPNGATVMWWTWDLD